MLMANLYVGVSGLQTSQNALNTTAHNLANIGTEGYTRQQVSLGDRKYQLIDIKPAISHKQTGLGVAYVNCKQVRSVFLDASYRLESGRSEFYDISYETLEQVEDLLQEMNGAEFADNLTNLWTQVQEVAKDPTSAVNQAAFVNRCAEFVESAKAVYKGFVEYQENLNKQVKTLVDEINDIGDGIRELNQKIVAIESGYVEKANDLRDTRNSLLDRLGELGNITYEEDIFGNVLVNFEGTQFVLSDNVHHLGCDIEESPCNYYTVYWEYAAKRYEDEEGNTVLDISGAHVYDLTKTVSTQLNTDVGELRSTLLARGDHNATYHDITDDETGVYYNKNIAQSVIMNIEAEFDQMFHNIVSAINEVYENAASNPATLQNLKDGRATANPADYVMFNMIDDDDALIYDIDSDHTAGNNITGLTIVNTEVNEKLLQTPTINTFVTIEGEEDTAAATALKEVFTDARYTLNPNVATRIDLMEYYDALVAQVANTGSINKALSENQTITVNTISAAREQIVGVSSDEELEFMIEFQNAYNASSRFINVVNEMLEHIITSLGR
ncbi:flagellar hook-associated protein 1 FlgK [Butyrivibrio fibrisolvens DSM 3071]|uniref:Flagellar hook-associated protein 1 n=2 Tax=Butyrivibrio fibrisolvens TaxID=831 RepID=A0A1M5ZWV2_BUTFI|nr:flagellar hook-associated protein FlgK [Butyrivibrio fibrisolvens]SHI28519.1 flagellar hook-associated protein 1 FlgK [Butyrivibrio fibrisolvens DSM 3071]